MDLYLGEMAALGTACLWAFAVSMHAEAGRMIGPFRLNLIRLPLSVFFLMLMCLVAVRDFTVAPGPLVYISLSGVVGLALGDTMLYAGLVRLGARTGVLIFSSAPAMTAVLAYMFLGEVLSPMGVLGIVITLAGIFWVIAEKPKILSGNRPLSLSGVGLVFLSALCQAGGMVLMKKGLTSDIHSIYATLIRMVAATVVIWPAAFLTGRAENPAGIVKSGSGVMKYVVSGALAGPVVGVWLSLVAVRYTETGIAATLIALEPIVMIPLAMVMERDRPSVRALAGTVIAVSGSAILFLR